MISCASQRFCCSQNSGPPCRLIPKEFSQGIARLRLPRDRNVTRGGNILAPDHFKILAVVGQVLFRNRIGAAVSALVRYPGIITDAITAGFEVRTARRARFGPAGSAWKSVFCAAIPAMSCQRHAEFYRKHWTNSSFGLLFMRADS